MHTDFSRRLVQACSESRKVPPAYKGRGKYLADALKVSQETTRKWLSGEARPTPDKMKALAELLEVDEAWLAIGTTPELDRREKHAHAQAVDGSIYLVYGMVLLAGGSPAFPKKKAEGAPVDLYAIFNGTQYSIYVAAAQEKDGAYTFYLPKEYAEVTCIGVVPLSHTRFMFLHLTPDLIGKHKASKQGGIAVEISKKGSEFATGRDVWPRLDSFDDL